MKVKLEYSLGKDLYYKCKITVLESELPSHRKVFRYARTISELEKKISETLDDLKNFEYSVLTSIGIIPNNKTLTLKDGHWHSEIELP